MAIISVNTCPYISPTNGISRLMYRVTPVYRLERSKCTRVRAGHAWATVLRSVEEKCIARDREFCEIPRETLMPRRKSKLDEDSGRKKYGRRIKKVD